MQLQRLLCLMYMSDSMDCKNSEDETVAWYMEVSKLWEAAGVHTGKWVSNSETVSKQIP